jgi:predicted HTH domain antitoxin
MVASKIANMRQGERTDIASIEAMSQTAAAELLNVARSSVQRAENVREHGSPDLVAAVESGAVSVSAASDLATLPYDEQTEIVARGKDEILAAAKKIRGQLIRRTN